MVGCASVLSTFDPLVGVHCQPPAGANEGRDEAVWTEDNDKQRDGEQGGWHQRREALVEYWNDEHAAEGVDEVSHHDEEDCADGGSDDGTSPAQNRHHDNVNREGDVEELLGIERVAN